MWTLVAIVAGLVAATWFVNVVNARHEAKRAVNGPSDAANADLLVEEAWDEFTAHDEVGVMRDRFGALMTRLDVNAIAKKQTLVRLAMMAVRAENADALVSIADRASVVDPGCGETGALDALAEAYAGPREVAIQKLRVAGSRLGACSGCGAGVEGGLLVNEVSLALDVLVRGEDLLRGA